jgi:serine/threonine protein phosphatase PrpC
MSIALLSAADSNIGKVRSSNQDSGYAGYQMFFVADGMGGHAGGDIASAITAQRMAQMDAQYVSPDDAGAAMLASILETNQTLTETVASHSELAGMGTTFSGLVFVEDKVVVGHIGDSRIYLSRNGKTSQITKDHTFVQRLVELGRITEEEALTHPRRNVLLRVIGDNNEPPQLDFQVLATVPGDRWMMCSDGLNGYVSDSLIHMNLSSQQTPAEAVELLIGEALEAGAPDNVTVVVVDIVPAGLGQVIEPNAKFVGSASRDVVIEQAKGKSIVGLKGLFSDISGLEGQDRQFVPESGEGFNRLTKEAQRSLRSRRLRQVATIFGFTLLSVAAIWLGYNYTQTKFYVAESAGHVAIYKGIREELLGFKFSTVFQETNVIVTDLPEYQQQLVSHTIYATDLQDAMRILNRLKASVNSVEQ